MENALYPDEDPYLGLVCPSCGYDLTALKRPECPECGLRLDARELRRTRGGQVIRRRLSALVLWSAAVLVLFQLASEYYIRIILTPRLETAGTSLRSYAGDFITWTSSLLPLIALPMIFFLSMSLVYRGFMRDERVPVRRASTSVVLCVIGAFLAFISVSRQFSMLFGW
ncbi:MAG: hypothetical protein WD768_21520 [Phycisphaeraceae bacterium]